MDKKEFGRHLHRLMVAKGWLQAELARQAGLSRNTITTYIRGRSYPSRESLEKLASVLGITPDELLPEHEILPVRGELPAEVELRVSPDKPNMAYLAIRRWMPFITASRIISLINGLENAERREARDVFG